MRKKGFSRGAKLWGEDNLHRAGGKRRGEEEEEEELVEEMGGEKSHPTSKERELVGGKRGVY